jgi:CSLREA domain-containing protein
LIANFVAGRVVVQRRINSKSDQPRSGRRAFAKRAAALAVGLIFVVLASPALAANTYVVNSTLDEPDADPSTGVCSSTPSGKCTLRAAIMLANFVTGPNTITVPSGIYLLTRPGYDDDALVGDLDIKHDLTIQGAGSGVTIIDGNGSVTHDRVFQILSTVQNVTLSGMTIRNGESLNSTVGVIGGGGLYIEGAGAVHLSDVIVDSDTGQNGGGIYANFSSQGGSLELDHVILHANTAIAGGVGAGGGVFAHIPSSLSQVIIRDSQVYSNTADGTGGGLYVDGNSTAQWSIQRSDIYSNTAASGGGIGNFVPLTLSDSSLRDNHVTFDGGAIEAYAPFAMNRTTLNANSAGRFGGAIFSLKTSAYPGYTNFAYIVESTLSRNSAQNGGGIYHDGFIYPDSLMALINSTLSGNAVNLYGGGIYMYSGHAQLLNATVASNRVQLPLHCPCPGIGGGLYIYADATDIDTFIAQNSLIANNARGNGIMLDTLDDGFTTHDRVNFTPGAVTGNLGYNLIRTTTNFYISGPQGGNIFGQDPLLGPLQNNGGSTQTHALLPGSPAIDAGAATGAPARDQRNYIRPDAPDIGAFEFGGTIPVTLANISTRAFVQTGDNVMIGGFIITGGGQKKVIVRAIGPSLVNHGITNPLQDPTLELHDHTGAVIAFNDNWMDEPNRQAIIDSGLPPSNNLESAILTNLDPGNYTAIVRGVNNGTGIGLVEAYDLDPVTAGSKLGNISTRAFVQTGDNVMIGGLIVRGPDSENVIVRAIGPSLVNFGITNALADPFLELHDANGVLITSNDNWKDTQQAQIEATGLAPTNDKESAIVATLAAGNYTAIVRGVNDTTGVALVEVFGLN